MQRNHFSPQPRIAVLSCLLLMLISRATSAQVFINELHYDNTGSDTGEAVEVAGPAGSDLTGWSIVLYNGSGGADYDTINLSGTIPDQCNGFGTLSFEQEGIQNGPDGLALVDDSNTVVEFLSYEGIFAATDGPANGMTSVDIGVAESNLTTPVGESLQRTGTGSMASDFTWAGPAAGSFGDCNDGQTFAQPSGTILTFSQAGYMFDEDGTPVGSAVDVERSGDLSGASSVDVTFTDGTATGGTSPLGASEDYDSQTQTLNFLANESSSNVDIIINDDGESEGSEMFTIALSNPSGATVGTPGSATVEIVDNDVVTPQVVINEVLADPAPDADGDANGDGTRSTDDDEFVEIVNTAVSPLDISGWTLSDGLTVRHTFPEGTVLAGGCAMVVFGGGEPTGSFGGAEVQVASSLGLNNGGDTVTLNDGNSDVASFTYGSEGGDDQSLTRSPDLTGEFEKHSTASGSSGALFSPGQRVDGTSFSGCQAPSMGAIKITKTVEPAAVPETGANWSSTSLGDWKFTVGSEQVTIPADGGMTTLELSPGDYTVTETVKAQFAAEYALDGVNFMPGASTEISLAAGETVEITFRNTLKTGTINIVKEVTGEPPGNDWEFTLSGPFDISVAGLTAPTAGGPATALAFTPPIGEYTITESPVPGYSVSAEVWEGTNLLAQSSDGSITFDLEAGQTLEVRFLNRQEDAGKVEVNDRIKGIALLPIFTFDTPHQFMFNLQIRNTSNETLLAPLCAVIRSIDPAPPDITVVNADNAIETVGAVFDYSDELGDGRLDPGETSNAKTWIFQQNRLPPFNFTFFADVQAVLATPGAASMDPDPLQFEIDVEAVQVDIITGVAPRPAVPTQFALEQNYPNPFNPETVIRYTLPEAAAVELVIYNLAGQPIRKLIDAPHPAGGYTAVWDGRDDLGREVASGVYVYRLETSGGRRVVKKMALVR